MGLFEKLKKRKPTVSLETIRQVDLGNKEAEAELTKAFERGLTAEEHNELRRQAYCWEAVEGDSNAQYWMGFLSSVVDRNAKMAAYWYECSAKQGNVEAMRELAFGYGEFLNTSNLGYGPIPLGYDKDKEEYWLQQVSVYE